MKKILFGITNLEMGGAERVLIDIVNSLCDEYDIEVLTIYKSNANFKINEKVKITSIFNKSYKETKFLKRKYNSALIYSKFYKNKLYKKYEDKDIIISFLEGPMTKLLKDFNKYKIAWIHTDLSKHYSTNKLKEIEKDYEKYNKIIFVSNESKLSFDEIYENKFVNKELVINNFIDKKKVINLSNENIDFEFSSPNFLVVARLESPKGIERLINVHSLLLRYGIKQYIYVIGEGSLKEKLENLIKEKNISDTFILLGLKENPYPYIRSCDTVLVPSLYEGYGMSAIESKILGKFIISTNTGVKEAIKDYDNKIICDNNEIALYSTLKTYIENRYIQKENVKYEYEDKILDKIKELLEGK